ncbi:MAG TPA: PKD domain-containing protein, partial [Actinomycetota bacterium]|nr:PKD domain-containing protein [Actinomycetota bacterium]
MSLRAKQAWLTSGVLALAVAVTATILVLSAGPAKAREFATLRVLAGAVELRQGQAGFEPAQDGMSLQQGDTVRTESDGRAEIAYFDGSTTRLDYDTTFTLRELASIPASPGSKIIRASQDGGRTFNRITELTGSDSSVELATPNAVASVVGTVYFTQRVIEDDGSISYLIGVLEGAVRVTGENGEVVVVRAGEFVVADSDGNLGPVLPITAEMFDEWLCEFNEAGTDECGVEEVLGEGDEPEDDEGPDQDGEDPGDILGVDITPVGTPSEGNPGDGGNDGDTPNGDGDPPPPPPPPPPPGDTTAPNTFITQFPPDPDNSSSGEFRFLATENGSTFECAFGDEAFQACASPHAYSFDDGGHTFAVRARDAANNVDATPAVYSWTIDTVEPQTSILGGPDELTNSRDATFTFAANEPVQEFRCKLDAGEFTPCESPRSYQGLADGSHTFMVGATDLAGNEENTAVWTWAIDATGPAVTIDSGPDDPTTETTATFEFSSPDADVDGFACSIDSGPFSTCESGDSFNVGLGSHVFAARASDTLGNVGAADTYSWTVEEEPPPNQAPVADLGADPTSGDAPLTVSFDGSGSDDPDGVISSWSLDFGDEDSTSDQGAPPSSLGHTYTEPGTYTATLTVTDDDGDTDTDSVSITVNEPPNQPPVADLGADPTSGDAPLTVSFDGSGSDDPDGVISSWSLDFGD